MAGKKRTVYFFEVVEQDAATEQINEITTKFWPYAHQHIGALSPDDRRLTYRGRNFEGEALQEVSPALPYIYLARFRPGADWPDVRNTAGDRTNLAEQGTVTDLMEPAYLVPVSGTNYVAVMRTSGGPSFSAIDNWLTAVCNYDVSHKSLLLRPYTRKDQLTRLATATGATKVHVKVDADLLDDPDPSSAITRALVAAQSVGSSGASIELVISFGHAQPDGTTSQELIDGLNDLLQTVHPKKATATLIRTGDDGEMVRDKVDFVRDRVTFVEEVGDDEDTLPSPPVVLSAMAEAVTAFRKSIAEEKTN